jgi:starch synthase
MTEQKGIDLMLGSLPRLLADGGQLAVLGSGDGALEEAVDHVRRMNPGRVAFHRGYDEPLSHRLIAGVDVLLVPSRFEPCGLTQMYAMRYGTPPIVRRTGGLADTVHDADEREDGDGFCFDTPTPTALGVAIGRAREALADPQRWRTIQRRGMSYDFGWERSANAYREAYRAGR